MASSSQELEKSGPSSSGLSSYFAPMTNVYSHFSRWRASLELPCPGSVENLQKECKTTLLTHQLFDGARADLNKSLSASPLFQVTHSFSLASQTMPSTYNFGAVFATQEMFLHGMVDHEGCLTGRLNLAWTENSLSKIQAQLGQPMGHDMIQLEQDYKGSDYTLNLKALNPSPTNLSGIYIAGYLQSITKNLAIGTEVLSQPNAMLGLSGSGTTWIPSLLAKYTGSDKNWIATAQVQSLGAFQATYWQKISDKVEAAADLMVIAQPGKHEGIATLAAKYELRMATFRAQVDSTGKVAALMEQRFTPAFSFTLGGEIDHLKNAAKIGLGVMIESAPLDEMAMEQQPYPPPSPYP